MISLIDAAHERGVEAEVLAVGRAMRHERGLARLIAHRMVGVGLDAGNLMRQPRALAQGVQQHLVQIVERLA